MTTSQITRFHHDFAKSDLILKKSMPQVPIEVRAEKRNSNWVIQMKNVAHLRQNRDPYPIIFSPCPACLVRWFHRIFNKTDQLENDGVKICIQSCPAMTSGLSLLKSLYLNPWDIDKKHIFQAIEMMMMMMMKKKTMRNMTSYEM